MNPDALAWEKGDGLLPAVVQDARSRDVLMVGYVSPESLARTLETGLVTFYSRSRKALWTKGESSGNTLAVRGIEVDCDGDALVIQAEPAGPTCHRGTRTCFDALEAPFTELWRTIEARAAASVDESYTARLLAGSVHRIAQKVGEEAVETALAAKDDDPAALLGEAADLVYHLFVLLKAKGLSPAELGATLAKRRR